MLHKLPPLSDQSAIQIVAMCGPPDLQKLDSGITAARALGYRPTPPRDIANRKLRYLAGTDEVRFTEFADAYVSDTPALWVARGGYGSPRLLPKIQKLISRGPPRWLIGFSDVTAAGCVFLNAGMPWLHAPLITTFASEPKDSQEHLRHIVRGKARGLTLSGKPLRGQGKVSGRLVGGNLTVFTSLLGTPYFPDVQGAILCFEDVGEQPYRIDRCITQLRWAGVFENAAAVVFGHFTDCEPKDSSYTVRDTLLALAEDIALPVMMDVAFGHQAPNYALPMGTKASADFSVGTLTFDEEMVRR